MQPDMLELLYFCSMTASSQVYMQEENHLYHYKINYQLLKQSQPTFRQQCNGVNQRSLGLESRIKQGLGKVRF